MLRKTTYSDADQHRMRRRIILSNARKQRFQQVEKHQNSSNSFIGPISTAQIRNQRKMILTATRNRNSVLLPPDKPHTAESLIDTIFPNISLGIIESDSAILSPKNADCETINAMAITKFNEETPIITLYSAA